MTDFSQFIRKTAPFWLLQNVSRLCYPFLPRHHGANCASRFISKTLARSIGLAALATFALWPAEAALESARGEFKPEAANGSESLVFIDGGIADASSVVRSVTSGHRVVMLDPAADELDQIGETLGRVANEGRSVKFLHIISHGAPGELLLGTRRIDSEDLIRRAAQFTLWHATLDKDAEVLLYGCEVGAGESGRQFLQTWTALTGAKVAASINPTGPSRLGCDWTLEVSTGPIHARRAIDPVILESSSLVLADHIFYHDGTAGKQYRADLDGANITTNLTYNGTMTTTALDTALVDPVHSVLYYVRVFNDVNRGLYKTDFTGTSPVRISPNTNNAVSGLSLDLKNNKLYLHDDTITGGQWYRCNLDGSGVQTLQTLQATAAFAAVDSVNSVLYYTRTVNDSNRGLYKTDLAMTTLGTRISSSNDLITGVALDPKNSKIYFHDSTTGQIIRANLDGSSPQNMLALTSPVTPITVDAVNGRVYYCIQQTGTTRGLYRTADLNMSSPVRISTSNNVIGPPGITTLYVPGPKVTGNISVPADGSFRQGQVLNFTLTFDSSIVVTGSDSTLGLTIGSTSASAAYASKTATSITYQYTVQAGDNDGDGISVGSVALNSSTVTDSGGTFAADLTLTGHIPSTSGILVDTTAPTVSVSAPATSITKSGPINFTVTWSDANFDSSSVTLLANQVTVNTTGTVTVDSISVSGTGNTRTVQLGMIAGDGTVGISIPANTGSDVAGNAAAASSASTTATIDNTAPSVTISSPSTSLTRSGPINFTVTWIDANLDPSSITLLANQVGVNRTGTVTVDSISVSGTGNSRTVQLSMIAGDGTVGISIPANMASDFAGNGSTASSASATVMVDNTAPTAPVFTSITTDTGSSSTDQITSDATLFFSGTAEANSTVTVTRVGTGVIGTTVTSVGGIWSFDYTGTTIAEGTHSFTAIATDAVAHDSAASATFNIAVDTTAPGVSISAPSATATSGSSVFYTVTYSDPNFDTSTLNAASDITLNVTGTASGTMTVTGTGNTRTVTVSSLTGDGTLGVSIGANTATDLAGNRADAAGPSATFVVDTTNDAPTIAGTVADQTVNDNATLSPFNAVVIGDSDQPAQTLSVTVNLDPAKGTLSTLNGFTAAGVGSFTFSGVAADATTAIQGIVYDPTDNRVKPGLTETNTLVIIVNDGQATPVTNDTTTVISTSINDAPIAGADSIQRRTGKPVKVSIAQLLSNDSDPEGETLVLSLPSSTSANGASVTKEGGWIIYSSPVSDATDTFQYTISDGSGGSTLGIVTVTVQADQSQSQNILSVVSDGSDRVITFAGISGFAYLIQYTDDLGSPAWTTLSTPQTTGSDGKLVYRDVAPPSLTRFYRSVSVD